MAVCCGVKLFNDVVEYRPAHIGIRNDFTVQGSGLASSLVGHPEGRGRRMNRKKTVLVAWAMVLGGTALVAGLVANSFADEAVVTEIEAPTEQSEVTIDLPQLDPSLKGVELATSAADSIEIKTSGPLVIASSTTRPLPGQSSDAFTHLTCSTSGATSLRSLRWTA